MRKKDSVNGTAAQAVAGTHVVLLGMDVSPDLRSGLLGFAIERTRNRRREFLPNFLRFAHNDHPNGPISSRENPIQAFQWGDYGVEPGERLTYTIHPVHGTPQQPELRHPPVTLPVSCERADDGRHGIYFNRGVAGSQAYARKFGRASPLAVPEARTWLSRGLEEGALAFLERATGVGFELHGALYEFFHPPILNALRAAALRGVKVRLVVSCPSEARGWPEHPSPANAEAIRAVKSLGKRKPFIQLVTARRATRGIAHNKFIVLSDQGQPQAVWTGSTNITAGAIYGHSNVGHAIGDPAIANAFLAYWNELAKDPATPALSPWVEANTPLPPVAPTAPLVPRGARPVFSPRGDTQALDRYIELMGRAGQAIFFTAPFGVTAPFEVELRQHRGIPRYLLLDKPGNDMELARADPDNRISVGAFLGQPGGYRQFLQEHLTGLNQHVRFIHTKYLLVDPLTDHPVLVTGSANFSEASTVDNDENMVVISGDKRAADIYLTEFMRLFTHLRFRSRVRAKPDQRAPDPREPEVSSPLHLREDDTWTDEYFRPGSPKERERLLFSGAM
jgi:phosphatidylserine/phosphatidylglycerophosphate/cardiolipin synthase-like enzyme